VKIRWKQPTDVVVRRLEAGGDPAEIECIIDTRSVSSKIVLAGTGVAPPETPPPVRPFPWVRFPRARGN
jgi:hypothetical protein